MLSQGDFNCLRHPINGKSEDKFSVGGLVGHGGVTSRCKTHASSISSNKINPTIDNFFSSAQRTTDRLRKNDW